MLVWRASRGKHAYSASDDIPVESVDWSAPVYKYNGFRRNRNS